MESARAVIPCRKCPLLDCGTLRPLTPAQLDLTQWMKNGELHFEKGGHILAQGVISPHIYTLLMGIAFRFKTMEDGRRQIVNFHFPGDIIGLQAMMDDPADHGIEVLTPARLCIFPRRRIYDVFARDPSLGYDLTWLAAKEETALDDHLLALGRRRADERITNLALFLLKRGWESGLTRTLGLAIPLSQAQIADTMGLSVVHTNKTLQSLRRRGIVDWRPDGLRIVDLDRAMELAGFDQSLEQVRPFI